ncbi:VWA-like domain-containing protein [Trichocoleus desertorum]
MKDLQIISASLLRLRMKSPFFATLALFARFIPTQHTPTAATDGKDIFFNPNYLRSLPSAQQDGLLLHEVLHAALLHTVRRGVRDPKVWNIAADIVVNGMIVQQGVFDLPPGGVRDPKLEHLSVEEICELLLKQDSAQLSLPNPDLLDRSPNNALSKQNQGTSNPSNHEAETETQSQKLEDKAQQLGDKLNLTDVSQDASRTQLESPQVTSIPASLDSLSQARKATLETHWKNALQQSMVIARTVDQGKLPAGLERELGVLTAAQIDWRSYLWRYLVRTPTDFMGFDRRFVGRGLYLESLVGESVRVFVAVDTSGSIDQRQLRLFLSEVQGILGTYPHLQCDLYYADAEIYGPYVLDPDVELPAPKGGGGTSFVPFFQQVAEQWDGMTMGVCIYLTDGYGQFPTDAPCSPVLWVVTSGGLALEQFPFGEAVRLLSR